MRHIVALVGGLIAAMAGATLSPVSAQSWADGARSIVRFETCLPEQMEAFEARLDALPGFGVTIPIDAVNAYWVQHCGYLAMGICQVSSEPLVCQQRLREAFDRRTMAMREFLPAPAELDGLALSPLYSRIWEIGNGTVAGDDCAGDIARRQLWCQSFHAVLKLEEAIWAWQVGRLAGATGPLDWADLARLEE